MIPPHAPLQSDADPHRLAQVSASAEQPRPFVGDQEHRDLLEVGFETPFVFKGNPETGTGKELLKAWHYAASDIDAAVGTHIEGQIAGKATHQHAEQAQGTTAIETLPGQCALGNVFGDKWLGLTAI